MNSFVNSNISRWILDSDFELLQALVNLRKELWLNELKLNKTD